MSDPCPFLSPLPSPHSHWSVAVVFDIAGRHFRWRWRDALIKHNIGWNPNQRDVLGAYVEHNRFKIVSLHHHQRLNEIFASFNFLFLTCSSDYGEYYSIISNAILALKHFIASGLHCAPMQAQTKLILHFPSSDRCVWWMRALHFALCNFVCIQNISSRYGNCRRTNGNNL